MGSRQGQDSGAAGPSSKAPKPSKEPSAGWPTLVAVGSGALASPFPSPALSLCLGLCAVCPSRPVWLALAPTPLSSAAAPCRALAHAPALAPAAGALVLVLGLAPARALAVCSLALFPFPVPFLKSQTHKHTPAAIETLIMESTEKMQKSK